MTTTEPTFAGEAVVIPDTGGLWRNAFKELSRKRSARIGFVMLTILLLAAVFAPLIAPYDPNDVLLGEENISPRDGPCVHAFGCDAERPQHILGIDGNGRDQFSRLLFGARVSLLAGLGAVAVAVTVGTLLGLIAGYFGGRLGERLGKMEGLSRFARSRRSMRASLFDPDNIIMRSMDVLLAFPALLLAIAIVSFLGPGLINAVLAISIVTIPIYARVVRSAVLSVRENEYVEADRALGVSSARIIWNRILPNSLTPLVVAATLGVATAVLEIAALSFLGLGVQPPTAEWGSMLASERNQVLTAPHLVFFPGLAIMWNVLAFNLLGDGLRDALDPRLNR